MESVYLRLRQEMGMAQLMGQDPAFVATLEAIPLLAASLAPVLLSGETGTGKELCARAIHHLSRREGFPSIPVECGALPDHLAENEIFGHVRGTFTDAHADQKGLAAMAEGGTLVLDEIDSLSLAAQAKLLRFLEDGACHALRADSFTRANVRVIAATNRDLESCVREKQFRSDLYFRLNVLQLRLPPLRDRRGDISVLARHFLASCSAATGVRPKSFSPATGRATSANCITSCNVRWCFVPAPKSYPTTSRFPHHLRPLQTACRVSATPANRRSSPSNTIRSGDAAQAPRQRYARRSKLAKPDGPSAAWSRNTPWIVTRSSLAARVSAGLLSPRDREMRGQLRFRLRTRPFQPTPPSRPPAGWGSFPKQSGQPALR